MTNTVLLTYICASSKRLCHMMIYCSKQRKLGLSFVRHYNVQVLFSSYNEPMTCYAYTYDVTDAASSTLLCFNVRCSLLVAYISRYDRTTRPVKDDNTTITANVAISLYHILDTVSAVTPLYRGRHQEIFQGGARFSSTFLRFFAQKVEKRQFWGILQGNSI